LWVSIHNYQPTTAAHIPPVLSATSIAPRINGSVQCTCLSISEAVQPSHSQHVCHSHWDQPSLCTCTEKTTLNNVGWFQNYLCTYLYYALKRCACPKRLPIKKQCIYGLFSSCAINRIMHLNGVNCMQILNDLYLNTEYYFIVAKLQDTYYVFWIRSWNTCMLNTW